MSKIEKLIEKLRNNPRADIDYILTIPAHKPIKPIYIMKLLKMIDEIRGDEDE